MGETSDNDDDLRSELNDDDDDERVGSMEPLRVGGEAAVAAVLARRARCPGDRTHTHTRTCTSFCWLNTHIYTTTPTHGPYHPAIYLSSSPFAWETETAT